MSHYSPAHRPAETLQGGAVRDFFEDERTQKGLKIAAALAVLGGIAYVIHRRRQMAAADGEGAGAADASAESGEVATYARELPRKSRGSIMDQAAGAAAELASGDVPMMKDAGEMSGGAASLPSSDDLAMQSMEMYEDLARQQAANGGRVRQEGENPMFHSQYYYEEGSDAQGAAGSGDAEREVMANLVSATGGIMTQAEDLFAAGNEPYERDAWGMYKPSLATLQRARDLGSRVAGGVLAQASDGWAGRSVGGNGVTADPSRSLYALQDQLADTTKVAVDSLVQNVLRGDITASGALPVTSLPPFL